MARKGLRNRPVTLVNRTRLVPTFIKQPTGLTLDEYWGFICGNCEYFVEFEGPIEDSRRKAVEEEANHSCTHGENW